MGIGDVFTCPGRSHCHAGWRPKTHDPGQLSVVLSDSRHGHDESRAERTTNQPIIFTRVITQPQRFHAESSEVANNRLPFSKDTRQET